MDLEDARRHRGGCYELMTPRCAPQIDQGRSEMVALCKLPALRARP
jgi:hypothetical protein